MRLTWASTAPELQAREVQWLINIVFEFVDGARLGTALYLRRWRKVAFAPLVALHDLRDVMINLSVNRFR